MKLVVGLVGNATGCGVCRCAHGLEVEAAPEGLESNDDEDNDDEQYIKRNLPRACCIAILAKAAAHTHCSTRYLS